MSNANNANPTFPSKSKAPVAVVFFIIIHSAYVGNIYRNGCFLSPWSRRLLTPCKIFSAWVVAKNFYIFIFQEIYSFTELRAIVYRSPTPGTKIDKSVTAILHL
jgi:hypothetical protein